MSTPAATDLLSRSPTELAALVRGGDVTSRELVSASLERIDAIDEQMNAFNTLDAERALAAADAIGPGDERPFAGVPIATKDLFPLTGVPLSMGSDLLGDFVPQHDSTAVRRIKDAGFVIVGVTNTSEFGILPVTGPRRFGPTRNPWDLDRTPGGSSGGAAAAVASGMVPVAHGSDGGGSIRIPSACCGLVGLKPTRGRISSGPDLGDHFTTTHGALTRTVADAASMLDVLAGYEVGDATWAPPHGEPFAAAARREPGRLRIATTTRPALEGDVHPAYVAAVSETAELLTSLGHEVEEANPPWVEENILEMFTGHFSASVALAVVFGASVSGQEPSPENVEPLTWELYQRALSTPSVGYLGAMAGLHGLARRIVEFLWEYDALLTPSLAEPPVGLDEIDPCAEEPMNSFRRSGRFTPFTAVFNVTGQPAITLPLFQHEDGLPLGVQLAGRPADEATLLSLGAQLEAARPWADRRPAV